MNRIAGADPLDCSRPATALMWLAIGGALALLVMAGQHPANWGSLLRVGGLSRARPLIERELGPIVPPDSRGHDGQIYYLIARDPFARGATASILASFDTNPPRYRYRRILLPMLAGGFGQFSGRATLYGITLLVALGMAFAVAAIADLAFQLRVAPPGAIAAILNLGALLGAMMLTVDLLALGLALAGVALAGRRRTAAAIVFFALAGLTKEIYLLAAFSIAAWRWFARDRAGAVAFAIVPVLPVAVWSACVAALVPAMPMKIPPFGLPFAGMFHSVSLWMTRHGDNPGELIVAAYVALSFLAATAGIVFGRSAALRWVAVPWIAVAVCSTPIAVWDIPSNVARQFAILWPVGMLLIAGRVSAREP